MTILRLLSRVALWGFAWLLLAQAWISTASASAFDSRVPWGLGVCAVAWLGGTLVAWLLARWQPERFARLDATRHGLSLVAMALCAHALSHAGADMSIRAMREEIPALLAPVYPLLAALAPLLLATGRDRPAGRQCLLLAAFAMALGGSVFLLEASVAAGLGLVTLLLVIAEEGVAHDVDRLLLPGGLFVALAGLATVRGHSLLAALPSLTWIVGLGALGLAAALAGGGERRWRDLLGSMVLAATLVALCGVALTAWLGTNIEWKSALATRLVIFRQHPNFLAPFFGVHAVLAAGLGLRRRWSSVAWLAAAALLAASTAMTDSRTGVASMAIGFVLLPACWMLRRVRARTLVIAVVLLPVLAAGFWFAAGGERATAKITAGIDRFQKSMEFRVDAWRNSVQVVNRHPWLGIGPHTFIAVERFRPGSRFYNEPESPHPHNVLLYVAQSAGLPALAAVLLWCGWLLVRCWRRYRAPDPLLPAVLPVVVLAATLTALMAGLFDLGLSLESVVPAPIFLFTGLLAAGGGSRRDAAPRPTRPAWAIAWAVVLVLLGVRFAVQPLRAQTLSLQAQLMLWEGQQPDASPNRLADARRAMSRAIEIHPPTPKAHDLLARWLEQADDFLGARSVLLQLVGLAPQDATGHSLVGHLYMRHGLTSEAVDELTQALKDIHGSGQEDRDRADRIVCLAQLGRRDDAEAALVEALALDSGVIALLPWIDATHGDFRLRVAGTPQPPPISLVDAAEILRQRRIDDHEAGRLVDRRSWMDTYRVFRVAKRNDRATAVLDWIEVNLPPGTIEAWTLCAERATMAEEASDWNAAIAWFQKALDASHNPYFSARIAAVRRQLGEAVQSTEQSQTAMAAMGEILDQPEPFRENFQNQARSLENLGQPVAAAEELRRTLVFEDDLLSRARLLVRIGELQVRGGRPDLALETLRQACEHLDAKPFPWTALQEGLTQTLPARLAEALWSCWTAQGRDRAGRLHEAWGLPDFFGSRQGPSLLRLAFYQRNAQVDQLLREAELQILADPRDMPALWARLFALEAAGRHLELSSAMRTLVEQYAATASAKRQYEAIAGQLPNRLGDVPLFEQAAVLLMLQGRYDFATRLFAVARDAVKDDPAQSVRLASWQAMAAFLDSQPEEARRVLREAAALAPDDEMLRQRLQVIPDVLPTVERPQ